MSKQLLAAMLMILASMGDVLEASLFAATPAPVANKTEGQAMAEELREQRPAENLTTTGTLVVRDSANKRRRIPVKFQVILADAGWRSVYEALDDNQVVVERLTVTHQEGRPNGYLLERSPTTRPPGETLVLTGDKASIPFARTDFWLADLGLEFFHWPDQTLVKKEMRSGRSCRVIQSVNPHPAPGNYSRVLSWVDFETHGLLRAEAYGPGQQLLKVFSVGAIKKVNGRRQVKELDILNDQTDSRTRLEFDLEVKEPTP